jgi:hypothetical protein
MLLSTRRDFPDCRGGFASDFGREPSLSLIGSLMGADPAGFGLFPFAFTSGSILLGDSPPIDSWIARGLDRFPWDCSSVLRSM